MVGNYFENFKKSLLSKNQEIYYTIFLIKVRIRFC